jgi:1,4-alpha-glucan branching enzyme
MDHALVHFSYLTGVKGNIFPGVRALLHGSWDGVGRRSSTWKTGEMERGTADDGCLCFRATVALDLAERGKGFDWGVSFIYPEGAEKWAIPTEIKDRSLRLCHRSFQFSGQDQDERYYLTHCRRLGANKVYHADGLIGVRFAVWAPNAQAVEVVLGTIWDRKDPQKAPAVHSIAFPDIAGGYIADDGTGVDPHRGPFAMTRRSDGVWETDPNDPHLANFKAFDHSTYMFRVTKNDGTVAFRTDLYSRCQIGYGSFNPHGAVYTGLLSDLDGSVSCSAVVDPETVTEYFKEEPPYLYLPPPPVRVWPEVHFEKDVDFWADEFTDRTVPSRIEDLIIYEMHMGALGFGRPGTGTLEDAIALLDHITGAGVNAIELLPLSEFAGGAENWGYATSHHFAVEYGGGGRDQYKFFVKECHRRGIAVIADVVYNHFAHDAERAEYHYDSNWPDRDIYYWYEGTPFDYTQPDGGYVDNMSTAYAPRYHEEMVRKLFISSAVALVQEFHVDGFRLDQTTSIHGYNRLHADGREVSDANIFGAKMLREFGRTLRMFKPEIILMAEDHSDWNEVTLPVEAGGMGFDARWYADFYHHLAGDTDKGMEFAKLIYTASRNQGQPLAMDFFAGALSATGNSKVVYSESHDEAGNSKGPLLDPEWDGREADKKYTSHRGIVVAVNDAPLFGETRRYAEARCRFAYGVTALSGGTPMFLFGEEVGAIRRFKYNAVLQNKEDLAHLAKTSGAQLYRFYGDLNRLRRSWPALRSHAIDIVYVHNANRVIIFRRWGNEGQFLIVASLSDQPFDQGYAISSPRLPDGTWEEILNSDASIYGGMNVGNFGGRRASGGGSFNCNIPANGLIVFRHV